MFTELLAMNASGGGIDISDLIAQTDGFSVRTLLNTYYAVFVVGISSISIYAIGTSTTGQMRDTNSDSGNVLANISSTPSTVDVSAYNVVYIKGTANQSQDFTIKVLS